MNPTSQLTQNTLPPPMGHTTDSYGGSAKEMDVEMGYSYFGARYYDSDLSIWLSVDPMSDKHPNFTPYAYVYQNPMNLIDPIGLDSFKINVQNHSIDRVNVEGSSSHTFIVQNGDETTITTLDINDKGLVKMPDSGDGFGRYGTVDEGGDHYLKPMAAAALFGLTTEMGNLIDGFNVDFGDMSSAKGKAPGGDHKMHGGSSGYSGVCVDFRYLDKKGKSYQGRTNNSKFSAYNNALFLQKAGEWGFTKNYASNRSKVWSFVIWAGTSDNIKKFVYPISINAKKIGGHDDHGHLTYMGGE